MDARTVAKGQLKHLVSNKVHVERIHQAVKTVNDIVINAYVFLRLRMLKLFTTAVDGDVRNFDREAACRLSAAFPLSQDCFDNALDVVSSKLENRVGRPYGAAKQAEMETLHEDYEGFAKLGVLPRVKPAGTNLSYCLQYECETMQTAYHNNVFMHFDKYVRRYVNTIMTADVLAAHPGVETVRRLPPAVATALRHDVAAATKDILDQRDPPVYTGAMRQRIAVEARRLVPIVPQRVARPTAAAAAVGTRRAPTTRTRSAPTASPLAAAQARLYDQKAHPERWLPHMVYIVVELERLGAKLYEPMPQRSSLVPCNVTFDTQALFDLLVHDNTDEDGGVNELQRLHDSLEALQVDDSLNDDVTYELPGVVRFDK